MRMTIRTILLLILMQISPATAQPSFDCDKAGSEVERLVCSDDALAVLDRRLSERYEAALEATGGLDAGATEARNTLRASQRGWVKGRDDCWKANDLRACVVSAYLIREVELVALWLLQDPTSVRGYICQGNPANEVTAFFFDTELPGLRLEYGDSIRAGWNVRSASGARYATAFGGMFWTKGDTALFAWSEGREMSCRATN